MDPRIENFQPCCIVTNSDSNREQLIAVGQILLFTERNSVCWSMAKFFLGKSFAISQKWTRSDDGSPGLVFPRRTF
jgi:hypothetical protein